MTFESPAALLLLLAVPVLLLLAKRKSVASVGFSELSRVRGAGKSTRQRLLPLLWLLRAGALALLIVAIARPRKGTERVRDVSQGIAIEMVVDKSSSMGAGMDFDGTTMNRLETCKRIFEEFVTGNDVALSGRPNDLIGMITFARYADTVCPLTLAHGALTELLRGVNLVERGGPEDATAIGDAVALAAARLQEAEHTLAEQLEEGAESYDIKSKIIIVLTDGESNAGRSPLEAARLAAKWGISVYTIAVSSPETELPRNSLFGAFPAPMAHGRARAALQQMAEESDGIFRAATDADSLRAIYEEIDKLEKSEIESVRFTDYRERFAPFALAALAFLCIEILLRCTVLRQLP